MGLRSVFVLLAVAAAPAAAQQLAPLEAYGALPEVSHVAISPDGGLVALREVTPNRDVVRVVDMDRMESVGSLDVSRVKPWRLLFTDNSHLVVVASDTMQSYYTDILWEKSEASIYDVRDGSTFRLLHGIDQVADYQSGLGRIVGRTPSGDRLFMPAWVKDPVGNRIPGIFSVETDRRAARVIARGRASTVDWFMAASLRP